MKKIVLRGFRRKNVVFAAKTRKPFSALVHLSVLVAALLATPARAAEDSVLAARQVMDDFLTTFNARDEAAWADTLLFRTAQSSQHHEYSQNPPSPWLRA